jgi:F0F1-type ATP synthase membrane subunit b/b'
MVRAIGFPIFLLALLLAVWPAVPAVADTSAGDVAEETDEAWESFKAYLGEKKNDLVDYGRGLLEKTDAEIEKLEAEAAEASGDAQAAYRDEIDELKQKRAVAAEKLDELEKASADSWGTAKDGFIEAYKALNDACREAVAKFK